MMMKFRYIVMNVPHSHANYFIDLYTVMFTQHTGNFTTFIVINGRLLQTVITVLVGLLVKSRLI